MPVLQSWHGTVGQMEVSLRSPSESDFPQWKALRDSYLVFYETDLSQIISESLWNRILDRENIIQCHVAQADDQLVGLVHFFPHADTWNVDRWGLRKRSLDPCACR